MLPLQQAYEAKDAIIEYLKALKSATALIR